ncbi:MAG: Extracellular solute-binding protein family 5 [Candidatus Nomurabacteria bacterium GW2011_GWA2_40_9]|uniref:Extracellular solute-binding protein family 5 n=1 Tax=Candidatus Nomurabacteria bacterium GW2011_GWA2_40_9 TaxID=1618734 RepID=A0A0G0TPL1_9BACT|nr:MAG: Extracellular solute-binding protein family 5 [Candidatus Nomurabacteria bacterium GW2011_GWA2_40_9]
MENLFTQLRNLKLPLKIKQALNAFSKIEWYVFLFLLVLLLVSTLGILQTINKSFMVKVPVSGGSITEGIIGTPRFINPILATSDADKDLVSLIYGGLMRKSTDGELSFDLAEKVDVSKDGLSYTFTLKDKIFFHDDEPVTIDDIIFTIDTIKDPIIKSPYRNNWEGVTVTKIDEKTVQFILKQPYSSFLENATLGIMPKHIWKDSAVELNTANMDPIGSGPYMIDNLSRQSSGIINYYDLVPFKKFNLGKAYVKKITLKFYPNENDLIDALLNKEIEQVGSVSPENAVKLKDKGYKIESSTLPRIFGLFFNQNQNQLFTNKNIIKALDLAIDKDRIVKEVLLGYGVVINDPIPPNMINYQKLSNNDNQTYKEKLKKAEKILAKDGWVKNSNGFLEKIMKEKKKKVVTPLEFSISTGNAEELATSANLIKQDLESIGIKVEVKTFEVGNLNQMVIRPRKYEALLFGQIINHESDLFAFWHSSQRKDPGLNVAMYTNAKVDKILEEAFITVDEKTRIKKYAQFEDEIKKDMPTIFLYSPDFVYIVSKNLNNLSIEHIVSPADRLLNSYLWYTQTNNVWKIFSPDGKSGSRP